MNDKLRLTGGIVARIGGILIIIGAIMGREFPKPLWFVAAICQLINAVSIILNYIYLAKDKDKDDKK